MSSYLQVIGREMAKSERNYARGQISRWADTLHQMARILSTVEGRKHLVLFSEGFDGRLLFGRQPDFTDEEFRRETDLIERGADRPGRHPTSAGATPSSRPRSTRC